MKQITSIIRIAILLTLSFAAFILLFGEEQDEATSVMLLRFIIDKSLAFVAGYMVYKLYSKWSKSDSWIAAYDKWAAYDEEDDEPTPMYRDND